MITASALWFGLTSLGMARSGDRTGTGSATSGFNAKHCGAAAALELENPCGRSAGYRLDDHVRVIAGELLHISSVSRRDDAASQSYRGGNDDAVDHVT